MLQGSGRARHGIQSMFWEAGAPPATLGGSERSCPIGGSGGAPLLPPQAGPTRVIYYQGGVRS